MDPCAVLLLVLGVTMVTKSNSLSQSKVFKSNHHEGNSGNSSQVSDIKHIIQTELSKPTAVTKEVESPLVTKLYKVVQEAVLPSSSGKVSDSGSSLEQTMHALLYQVAVILAGVGLAVFITVLAGRAIRKRRRQQSYQVQSSHDMINMDNLGHASTSASSRTVLTPNTDNYNTSNAHDAGDFAYLWGNL